MALLKVKQMCNYLCIYIAWLLIFSLFRGVTSMWTQRMTCWWWLSLIIMWVWMTELKLSGLGARAFTCQVNSPSQTFNREFVNLKVVKIWANPRSETLLIRTFVAKRAICEELNKIPSKTESFTFSNRWLVPNEIILNWCGKSMMQMGKAIIISKNKIYMHYWQANGRLIVTDLTV